MKWSAARTRRERLVQLSAPAARAGTNTLAASSTWTSWPSMRAAASEERMVVVIYAGRREEAAPEVEAGSSSSSAPCSLAPTAPSTSSMTPTLLACSSPAPLPRYSAPSCSRRSPGSSSLASMYGCL
uniref:Uncharacterized protein n=1 Tax=Arundo donax TaxID=35708 RepID=A0A0A8Y9D4_ARUDO